MNARHEPIHHGRVFVQFQPHVREGKKLAPSHKRLRTKSYAFALDDVNVKQNQKNSHGNRNHHAVQHVELGPHAGRAHDLLVSVRESAASPRIFRHSPAARPRDTGTRKEHSPAIRALKETRTACSNVSPSRSASAPCIASLRTGWIRRLFKNRGLLNFVPVHVFVFDSICADSEDAGPVLVRRFRAVSQ